jgi:hypothetical protein
MNDYTLKLYLNEVAKTSQYGAGVAAAIINSKVTKDVNQYPQQKLVTEKDQPLYKSKLGTPVFSNLEIQAGSWTNDNGVVTTWNALRFDTVLMTVDQPKVIVETVVQGKNFPVNEYISEGGWKIDIQLLLIGDNGVRPLNHLTDLKRALNAPVALAVNSRFLQTLDIHNIVVNRRSIPEVEGGYSFIPVSISATIDEPIELYIQ